MRGLLLKLPADRAGTAPSRRSQPAIAARLAPLARKGAYLLQAGSEGTVHVMCAGVARQVATLPAEVIEAAVGEHWLASAPGNRLVLTKAGVEAVKRRLSSAPTAAAEQEDADAALPQRRRMQPPTRNLPGLDPDESPLAWLRRRKGPDGKLMISAEEFEAGERLRADFWRAQMTPRITTRWDPTAAPVEARRGAGGAGVEMRDAAVAAAQRVRDALCAVGPELAGVLIDVCCHNKGLEQVGHDASWPRRTAKVILQLALQSLARHYGLIAPDGGAWTSRAGIGHWGAADYRPNADRWK